MVFSKRNWTFNMKGNRDKDTIGDKISYEIRGSKGFVLVLRHPVENRSNINTKLHNSVFIDTYSGHSGIKNQQQYFTFLQKK